MGFKDAFISSYEQEKAKLAEEQEAKKAAAVAAVLEKKKRKELAKQHHPTRQVKGFMSIDENHKTWTVLNDKTYKGKAYQYSEIRNIDVYEDNNQVTKGSIGSVVAGGVISGGIGAMLGGVVGPKKTQGTCDNLRIKITTNIIDTPIIYIEFISRPTKKKVLNTKMQSRRWMNAMHFWS